MQPDAHVCGLWGHPHLTSSPQAPQRRHDPAACPLSNVGGVGQAREQEEEHACLPTPHQRGQAVRVHQL